MRDLFGVRGRKDNSKKKGAKADAKARRVAQANERNAEYAKLTVEEKLARLDKGGFKATKQRAKLQQGRV